MADPAAKNDLEMRVSELEDKLGGMTLSESDLTAAAKVARLGGCVACTASVACAACSAHCASHPCHNSSMCGCHPANVHSCGHCHPCHNSSMCGCHPANVHSCGHCHACHMACPCGCHHPYYHPGEGGGFGDLGR
jgi:hypothetical protein